MAVASQEGSLAETIVGIVQETRQVLAESRVELPVEGNGKLRALEAAIGQFGVFNLAQLSLGKPPHSVGAEGTALTQGFLDGKRAWIDEETRLRTNVIAELARPLFVEAQNARLAELVDGQQFTIGRTEGSAYTAIRTYPEEGHKRIEGPVTGTLMRVRAEAGILILAPTAETAEPPTERGYIVALLDRQGEQQVDLQHVGQVAA